MSQLDDCRAEIDRLDREICSLYERRMQVAARVADYKAEHGLPVLQPEREEAVLRKAESRIADPTLRPGARRLFEALMAVSRELQTGRMGADEKQGSREKAAPPLLAKRAEGQAASCESCPSADTPALPVGFQGEEGSFSEAALEQAFGTDAPRRCYPRFRDVFEALQRGEIRSGVLPIENSSTGGINEVYDLLHEYDFSITGEEYVAVRQHLLGLPGVAIDQIREVRSHPQGLEQSRLFLSQYPSMRPVPWLNTAAAALSVAKEGTPAVAAIASRRAARLYGLEILAENINDLQNNTTRFVVVEREPRFSPADDKASVVFSLDDRSGTLYKLLGWFFEQSVNLLKIESRPLRNSRWKYFLYVDLEGNAQSPQVKQALEGIASQADYFRLLGSYRAKGAEK